MKREFILTIAGVSVGLLSFSLELRPMGVAVVTEAEADTAAFSGGGHASFGAGGHASGS